MVLNYKAVAIIIKGLNCLIASYREQIAKGDLTDDAWSDLTNDLHYAESLVADLRRDYRNVTTDSGHESP